MTRDGSAGGLNASAGNVSMCLPYRTQHTIVSHMQHTGCSAKTSGPRHFPFRCTEPPREDCTGQLKQRDALWVCKAHRIASIAFLARVFSLPTVRVRLIMTACMMLTHAPRTRCDNSNEQRTTIARLCTLPQVDKVDQGGVVKGGKGGKGREDEGEAAARCRPQREMH